MTSSGTDSPTPPEIVARPGTIPPARSGNVAYFANLSHIFFDNTELTDELRATVNTLETYGGRLFPVISLLWRGTDSLLALERRPLDLFEDYFGDILGLRLPRILTFDPDEVATPEVVAAICGTSDCHLDGFVTDRNIESLAESTGAQLAGSFEGSRRGNDKVLLHRYLESLGERVFDTVEVTSAGDVPAAAGQLASRGFKFAAAKSSIGASGIGLVRFETANPQPIPESHFHDGPCLIQGWLDPSIDGIHAIASPSVQMVVTADKIYLYDITDQILGADSVHEGNVSPPESFSDPSLEEELMRQAGIVGRWLHEQGYRGTASTDFHLAFLDSGDIEVRVCEVNARVTGATYPSMLARRFMPQGTWLMRNLHLPEAAEGTRVLEDLSEAGLLYHCGITHGVLPINFNLDAEGLVSKGQFLFLGRNLHDVHDIVARTLALKEVTFTRD